MNNIKNEKNIFKKHFQKNIPKLKPKKKTLKNFKK
jgi:hypothetical protein